MKFRTVAALVALAVGASAQTTSIPYGYPLSFITSPHFAIAHAIAIQ